MTYIFLLYIVFAFIFLAILPTKIGWMVKRITEYLLPDRVQTNFRRRVIFFIGYVLLFPIPLLIVSPQFVSRLLNKIFFKLFGHKGENSTDIVYPVMNNKDLNRISDAVSISFTGDFILLRDMVENSKVGDNYEFDYMFERCKHIWSESDLSIGVFEGPLGGGDRFSTSVYDDGIPFYVNYPDSYANSIKNAGISLVTTANNHFLDKGVEGAKRTLNILDKVGLDHVGTYSSSEDKKKNHIKIIEIKGLKIAIIAYTYGSEYHDEKFFFTEDNRYLTNIIVSPRSKFYKESQRNVSRDLDEARALQPDLIIVIPHMGGQFNSYPDRFQKKWCKFFAEHGANIILADHPHHVQPIEWIDGKDGAKTFVAHCPGNFINSYTEYEGDASMIINLYIDKHNKEIFASSIVPVYAYANQDGRYQGIPIYDLIKDNKLSLFEYNHVSALNKMITGVALGCFLDIDNAQPKYYYLKDKGYQRLQVKGLNASEQFDNSKLMNIFKIVDNICFIGDSITEGTKNGGYGWYEPIMAMMPEKKCYRFAKGGGTSNWLIQNLNDVKNINASLYVINIGCNDIRYRDEKICAMNSMSYINNIKKLTDTLKQNNRNCEIIYIAPWWSDHFDPYCPFEYDERRKLYDEYTNSLEIYCKQENLIFIDPNPYIWTKMEQKYKRYWLLDHIHPNANEGIRLFSEAVLLS